MTERKTVVGKMSWRYNLKLSWYSCYRLDSTKMRECASSTPELTWDSSCSEEQAKVLLARHKEHRMTC
jgi:hypothetical protein